MSDATVGALEDAATDITGFRLLGHLRTMLLASGGSARIDVAWVPVLDFARRRAEDGLIRGGMRNNLADVEPHCEWAEGVTDIDRIVLSDAQTSGGHCSRSHRGKPRHS